MPLSPGATDRLLPLEVSVNGVKEGLSLLIEHAGQLYAPRDAFEQWRVRINPTAQRIRFRGEDYWPLSAVSAYKSNIDFSKMTVSLEFSPEAFAETRLALKATDRLELSPTVPSLQLRYDASYQRSDGPTTSKADTLGLAVELTLSTNLGVLTTSAVASDLLHTPTGNRQRFQRLETTFTRDLPEHNLTLRAGDVTTRQGMIGGSAYFGGVRIGTNFALTPGFVTRPTPVLTGSSLAPSTVSLYINDVLRQTSNVPTGPFALDNFSSLSGSGEVRMVIRDVLGRETVISQSFFSSNKMLAPGLNDWSFETGGLRRSLGQDNASYGPLFVRGFWRHGYSQELTLEGSGEATPNLRDFKAGLQTPVFGKALGNLAFATSNESTLGSGQQWLLGFESTALHGSAYLQAIGSTRNYRELGQNLAAPPIRRQIAANWTYVTDSNSSFGVGYTSSSFFDQPGLQTYSASYSRRIGKHSSINVNFTESAGAFGASALGFSLVIPLERGPTIVASTNNTRTNSGYYVSATGVATQDNPISWRALTGIQQGRRREEGGFAYAGPYGNLTADVANTQRDVTMRLGAGGAMVVAGGGIYATRGTNNSFALVEIDGYPDVGAGSGGTHQVRTDSHGHALIPNLSPYVANSIRLEPNDLPASAEIGSIESTVVPAWRSVALAKFAVRTGQAAVLVLHLDDGQPAPAGATLQIEGDKEEFIVGRNGIAYVTGLQANNKLILEWNGRKCSFEVATKPRSPDDIPRMGPFACSGLKR